MSLIVFAIQKLTDDFTEALVTVNEAIDLAADENDTVAALNLCDVADTIRHELDVSIEKAWDLWCERAWDHVVANPFAADTEADSHALVMGA